MNYCATCGRAGEERDTAGFVDLPNRWFCHKHRIIRRAALAVWQYIDHLAPFTRELRKRKPEIVSNLMMYIEREIK